MFVCGVFAQRSRSKPPAPVLSCAYDRYFLFHFNSSASSVDDTVLQERCKKSLLALVMQRGERRSCTAKGVRKNRVYVARCFADKEKFLQNICVTLEASLSQACFYPFVFILLYATLLCVICMRGFSSGHCCTARILNGVISLGR